MLVNLCRCASIIKEAEPLKNWSIAYDIPPEGCFNLLATTLNAVLKVKDTHAHLQVKTVHHIVEIL
jgi:hypothetical protein